MHLNQARPMYIKSIGLCKTVYGSCLAHEIFEKIVERGTQDHLVYSLFHTKSKARNFLVSYQYKETRSRRKKSVHDKQEKGWDKILVSFIDR